MLLSKVSLYSVFGELHISGFIYLINCLDIFTPEREPKLINLKSLSDKDGLKTKGDKLHIKLHQ